MKTFFTNQNSIKRLAYELAVTAVLLIVFTAILKIVLYKENLLTLFMVLSKFFIAIIIPGLFLLSYLQKKLDFITRLILGIVLTLAITSILSYYLSITGLHVKYHPYLIPILIILFGTFLFLKNRQ